MKEIDPEGVMDRRATQLKRCAYLSEGTKFCWHIDAGSNFCYIDWLYTLIAKVRP